jgi:hypothetical protein
MRGVGLREWEWERSGQYFWAVAASLRPGGRRRTRWSWGREIFVYLLVLEEVVVTVKVFVA